MTIHGYAPRGEGLLRPRAPVAPSLFNMIPLRFSTEPFLPYFIHCRNHFFDVGTSIFGYWAFSPSHFSVETTDELPWNLILQINPHFFSSRAGDMRFRNPGW